MRVSQKAVYTCAFIARVNNISSSRSENAISPHIHRMLFVFPSRRKCFTINMLQFSIFCNLSHFDAVLYSFDHVQVLEKYGLLDGAPKSIREVLEKCPKEPEKEFEHVSNFIIGTNRIATEAAKNLALKLNFQCVIVSHKVSSFTII